MATVPSYPAFHTTGPVIHFVRVGGFGTSMGNTPGETFAGSGSIYYLGTCETQPKIRINRYTRPVFNDLAGRSVPMQETHDGEDADLGLMLSRFSQLAYYKIQAPETLTEPSPGNESIISRGSLVNGARTFELWQFFSFYGTPAATPGLPCGYYWPQVKLVEHAPEKMGSEGEVLLLTAKATPRWCAPLASGASYSTGASMPGGQFLLRTHNLAFFPSDTLSIQ